MTNNTFMCNIGTKGAVQPCCSHSLLFFFFFSCIFLHMIVDKRASISKSCSMSIKILFASETSLNPSQFLISTGSNSAGFFPPTGKSKYLNYHIFNVLTCWWSDVLWCSKIDWQKSEQHRGLQKHGIYVWQQLLCEKYKVTLFMLLLSSFLYFSPPSLAWIKRAKN